MDDQYSAVWVSHTSLSDFIKCPRSYYLKNIYKDPKTKHKVQLMTGHLALGQVVHEVLESLSQIPTQDRFKDSLIERFEKAWKNVHGLKGGFFSDEQETQFKNRGLDMIRRVINNPGPLSRLSIKIKEDLPHYWLSKEDNIILCGKIDWLEYIPDQDGVNIIDFKTSRNEEEKSSLQLPIYLLLVNNCQHRKVLGASYWYLDLNDKLSEQQLPMLEEATEQILTLAKQVKLMRQLDRFRCSSGDGCRYCKPFEKILNGEAQFVGEGSYRQDIYVQKPKEISKASELL